MIVYRGVTAVVAVVMLLLIALVLQLIKWELLAEGGIQSLHLKSRHAFSFYKNDGKRTRR